MRRGWQGEPNAYILRATWIKRRSSIGQLPSAVLDPKQSATPPVRLRRGLQGVQSHWTESRAVENTDFLGNPGLQIPGA